MNAYGAQLSFFSLPPKEALAFTHQVVSLHCEQESFCQMWALRR
jgi:hypothetical protein